jgi:hypothetical protein
MPRETIRDSLETRRIAATNSAGKPAAPLSRGLWLGGGEGTTDGRQLAEASQGQNDWMIFIQSHEAARLGGADK